MSVIWPTLPLFLSIVSMSCTSFGKVRTCFLTLSNFLKPKSCWNWCFYLFRLAFIHSKSLNYCFQKNNICIPTMALDSYGFSGSFLQTFLIFSVCFPPDFRALASPHTPSNPLSLRLCICPSLSLSVIPFFFWFMQVDSLPSSYFYFQMTHWIPTNPHFHLSLTTFHFSSESFL